MSKSRFKITNGQRRRSAGFAFPNKVTSGRIQNDKIAARKSSANLTRTKINSNIKWLDKGGKRRFRTMSQIPWRKIHVHIFCEQVKIAKLARQLERLKSKFNAGNGIYDDGKWRKRLLSEMKKARKDLWALQRKVWRRHEARAIAVRKVARIKKEHRRPGVDGVKRLEPQAQLDWIFTPSQTHDRLNQTLCKLVLEPQWEARFKDKNSFGGRPGRNAHDAIETVVHAANRGHKRFAIDADLQGCFDNMAHEPLVKKLDTFPEMETQIRTFLEAGILEGFTHSQTDKTKLIPNIKGTPQGGPLSLLLCNIALDGLETVIKKELEIIWENGVKNDGNTTRRRGLKGRDKAICRGIIVRFVDNFVITHDCPEVLKRLQETCGLWLEHVGLKFNPSKTKIVDLSQEGLDFLGMHICQVRDLQARRRKGKHAWGNMRAVLTPSKANETQLITEIKETIRKTFNNTPASHAAVIRRLRPKIIRWCNYFSICSSKRSFKRIDKRTWEILKARIRKVFGRQAKGGQAGKIYSRIFPQNQSWKYQGRRFNDRWTLAVFQGAKKGWLFLPKASWTLWKRHAVTAAGRTPFDGDLNYWAKRRSKASLLRPVKAALVGSQKAICPLCEQIMTIFDDIHTDHIKATADQPGQIKDNRWENLQAVHLECHVHKTNFENDERRKAKEGSVVANRSNVSKN